MAMARGTGVAGIAPAGSARLSAWSPSEAATTTNANAYPVFEARTIDRSALRSRRSSLRSYVVKQDLRYRPRGGEPTYT